MNEFSARSWTLPRESHPHIRRSHVSSHSSPLPPLDICLDTNIYCPRVVRHTSCHARHLACNGPAQVSDAKWEHCIYLRYRRVEPQAALRCRMHNYRLWFLSLLGVRALSQTHRTVSTSLGPGRLYSTTMLIFLGQANAEFAHARARFQCHCNNM